PAQDLLPGPHPSPLPFPSLPFPSLPFPSSPPPAVPPSPHLPAPCPGTVAAFSGARVSALEGALPAPLARASTPLHCGCVSRETFHPLHSPVRSLWKMGCTNGGPAGISGDREACGATLNGERSPVS